MQLTGLENANTLLQDGDPLPYEIINGESNADVVIICEHASQNIPRSLGNLGVAKEDLDKHIAWDIGAAAVARSLAESLNAPLILQSYSRLVIDCNRPVDALDQIPQVSDGVVVPKNLSLTGEEQKERVDAIFVPFHDAVLSVIKKHPRKAIFAIHSFTPTFDNIYRPWEVAFLYREDEETSKALAKTIAAEHPKINVGFNEPYEIDDESDYFVPCIGEKLNLAHSLIEIRNDQVHSAEGQRRWATIMHDCINKFMQEI